MVAGCVRIATEPPDKHGPSPAGLARRLRPVIGTLGVRFESLAAIISANRLDENAGLAERPRCFAIGFIGVELKCREIVSKNLGAAGRAHSDETPGFSNIEKALWLIE